MSTTTATESQTACGSISVFRSRRRRTVPRYKPLFAIRCLDLDGRLNVNAHGSSAHVENTYGTSVSGTFAGSGGSSITNSVVPNSASNPGITIGSGYGPAEINLEGLWSQFQTTWASTGNPSLSLSPTAYYAGLLAGVPVSASSSSQFPNPPYSYGVEGRYGESQYVMINGTFTTPHPTYVSFLPYPGSLYNTATPTMAAVPPMAGITPSGQFASPYPYPQNPLSTIKHFEFPIPGNPGMPTAYGSSPDLFGRGFVALGVNGAPLMPNMSFTPPAASTVQTGQYDTANNPYVLNLSRRSVRGSTSVAAVDNPFTVAELERVLRTYDGDVMALSGRLAALLDPSTAPPAAGNTPTPLGASTGSFVGAMDLLRKQVTTDSWDPPSPNVMATQDLRNGVLNMRRQPGHPAWRARVWRSMRLISWRPG